MAIRTVPAWLVKVGELVLLHDRGTQVLGAKWTSSGRARQRRIFYTDEHGKPAYEDFDPDVWLEVFDGPET